MSSLPLPFVGPNKSLLYSRWDAYVGLAASTVVVWDYFLTFERELELIWRQPKNGVSVLFLINRYLAIIAPPVMTYANLSSKVTEDVCIFAVEYWQIGTLILQLVLTDGILWLCVCALYKNSRKLRWSLLGLMALCVLSAVVVGFFISRPRKTSADLAQGCTISTPLRNLWLVWIPILVYETTILVLVLKRSIQYQQNRKEWSSNLLELLLKHMFFYFAFIFTIYVSDAVLFANPDVSVHLTPYEG
ncbi:hypothetical protein BDP27DRAFT_1310626 [Rhodocollybia butyracea]|uniref:DUF6533 domain-containing protein n=1 Tax=Rhodocollybia butyracea TaxID=206335 RepID=A0A9P5UG66_9AGAR|nr:hypothetical protein BDP27DRAFT_1310626 [Rhodocollybia butyracea]